MFEAVLGHETYSIQIDDTGSVTILNKANEIVCPLEDKDGYLTITFHSDGKRILKKVHRVVYETFVHKKPLRQDEIVDHIDRNKKNNQISNLRVVTRFQNCVNRDTRNLMLCVNIDDSSQCYISDAVSLIAKKASVNGTNMNEKITMKNKFLIIKLDIDESILEKYITIFVNEIGFIKPADVNDFLYALDECVHVFTTSQYYRKFLIKKATFENGDVFYFRRYEDFIKKYPICSVEHLKRVMRTPSSKSYKDIAFSYVGIVNTNYIV